MSEAELRKEIAKRLRIEALHDQQQKILRLIACGSPQAHVLNVLANIITDLFPPSLCVVMTYEERDARLRIGAAPNIDEDFQELLDGMPIGADSSSFALAAYRRETVIVTDIETDEACGATRVMALRGGYKSCWAHPALSPEGRLLGVIGMYHKEKRGPTDEELKFIIDASDLAGIAISRDQAEHRMQILSSAIEQTDDSVMITDPDGIVEFVNPAFERTSGFHRSEILGEKPNILKSGLHDVVFYKRLWETILRGEVYNDVMVNRRKDGTLYYEEKTISPVRDEKGGLAHFVSTGKDISKRVEVQDRLTHLAYHDVLTNLGNRVLLRDHLDEALVHAMRNDHKVALLYLDLDRFKNINDSLGHSVGDILLKEVAKRLHNCIRKGDTIARLGGDEFTILLPIVQNESAPAHVAENLLEALRPPISINGYELFVNASIGITIYPNDGDAVEDLLRNADLAMYRAKAGGGDTYEFFAKEMTIQTVRRLDMEHKLRYALERDEFSLSFQPRADIHSGKICSFETLLRWRQSELGSVKPVEFIPVLEDTGLIISVGKWVIQTACAYARGLRSAGIGEFRVAVNLSARQLRDKDLVKFIRQCLQDTGIEGHLFELEITESLLVDQNDATIAMLKELHNMGIRISIDDFGTGYSSLSYLKRLPINTLKIDRSFIHDLTTDADDRAIVTAIISMARSLGYSVTAEGVETKAQLAFLQDEGCDELQGYFLSPPLDGMDLEVWLAEQNRGAQPGLGSEPVQVK